MPARDFNLRKILATGAVLTGASLGAAGIAAAATSSSASSTTGTATAPNSTSSSGVSGSTAGTPPAGAPDPASLAHGPGETLLTGTDLTKAEAAATAAVPGGTIIRAETDSSGAATYEVHMKTSSGSYVTVELDSSFKVTKTISGFGAGPAGSASGGQPPSGGPGNGQAPSGSQPPGSSSSSSSSSAA